jgi:hypothetical protein
VAIRVKVDSYSGHRADERPLRLWLGDTCHEVERVEDRWYSPGFTFFRIFVRGGQRYLLRYDEGQDIWELVGFRAEASASAALTQE